MSPPRRPTERSLISALFVCGAVSIALLCVAVLREKISNQEALLVSKCDAEVKRVESREYKLLLNASAFNTEDAVSRFWTDLDALVGALGRSAKGSLALSKERTVQYVDTPRSCVLRARSLIYRERGGKSNLKCRSPDRLITAYTKLGAKGKTKFEEDVLHDWRVLYDHGTTMITTKNVSVVGDLLEVYPGLGAFDGLDETEALAVVGDLVLLERVYEGAKVKLGEAKRKADFSLTLWYAASTEPEPVLAEISFRIKDNAGSPSTPAFGGTDVLLSAKDLFKAMGTMSWARPDTMFKTDFVYAHNVSFCDTWQPYGKL